MNNKNLADKKQESGFKTPKNYFENFKVELPATNTELDFTKEKNAGFTVPKNYFNNFEVNLPVEEKETKVISLFSTKNIFKIASVAAVLIFVISILNKSSDNFITNDDLNQAAIEDYIDNNEIDYNSQDLYFTFKNNNQIIEKELEDINREELLEYLTENTEITSLLNE
ncbi:hypothetical protein [Mesonia aquimarina]|uniref:hypothetical protein n=1 Tax=Mesonia aquimarina TaxID=1504967 RepID=UPI000EF563FC|nr:hypothetical protein [Mesonia aquimarina]